MELKCQYISIFADKKGSNRTFMELKLVSLIWIRLETSEVLIVPLWN